MELAILLASYNGSKYILEQLNSLYNQTYINFNLYIRDDGSSDNTLEIIKQFVSSHNNIFILNDQQLHRGARDSFIWLLQQVSADYYMFCDQDDIWHPTKVERSLTKIREIEVVNKPAVVFTDLSVVDESLNIIYKSMWNYAKLNPAILTKKRFAISGNIFTGCTMLINNQAKEISLPILEEAKMHDSWIGLRILSNNGIVGYITEPLILYRQHGNNVCGILPRTQKDEINNNTIFYALFNLWNKLNRCKEDYRYTKQIFNSNLSIVYYLFWRIIYKLCYS